MVSTVINAAQITKYLLWNPIFSLVSPAPWWLLFECYFSQSLIFYFYCSLLITVYMTYYTYYKIQNYYFMSLTLHKLKLNVFSKSNVSYCKIICSFIKLKLFSDEQSRLFLSEVSNTELRNTHWSHRSFNCVEVFIDKM